MAAAGAARSSTGRAAQAIASPARSATLVANSVVCGAISRVQTAATAKPNTMRPRRPAGTVFGSVIMKNMKMRSSGDSAMARQ